MSQHPQEPDAPLTHAEIKAWMHQATTKRLQCHLDATNPFDHARDRAFAQMSELCKDAIEELRVVSEQIWETSQTARDQSAELIAHAVQDRAQRTTARESQTSGESQFLEMFKGNQAQHQNPE